MLFRRSGRGGCFEKVDVLLLYTECSSFASRTEMVVQLSRSSNYMLNMFVFSVCFLCDRTVVVLFYFLLLL